MAERSIYPEFRPQVVKSNPHMESYVPGISSFVMPDFIPLKSIRIFLETTRLIKGKIKAVLYKIEIVKNIIEVPLR